MAQEDLFKKIVAHAKEYGFVFPSSEIYDGLSAVYDYGQNGVELGEPVSFDSLYAFRKFDLSTFKLSNT